MFIQKRNLSFCLVDFRPCDPDLGALMLGHRFMVLLEQLLFFGQPFDSLQFDIPVIEKTKQIALPDKVPRPDGRFPDVRIKGCGNHSLNRTLDGGWGCDAVIHLKEIKKDNEPENQEQDQLADEVSGPEHPL